MRAKASIKRQKRHLEDLNLRSNEGSRFQVYRINRSAKMSYTSCGFHSPSTTIILWIPLGHLFLYYRLVLHFHEEPQKLTATSPGRRILIIESRVLSRSLRGLERFKRKAPPCSLQDLNLSKENPPVNVFCKEES